MSEAHRLHLRTADYVSRSGLDERYPDSRRISRADWDETSYSSSELALEMIIVNLDIMNTFRKLILFTSFLLLSRVAQGSERMAVNHQVVGSIPTSRVSINFKADEL